MGVKINTRKTTFLMALTTVILVTIGGSLAGQGSMTIAFLLALAVNNVSFHLDLIPKTFKQEGILCLGFFSGGRVIVIRLDIVEGFPYGDY